MDQPSLEFKMPFMDPRLCGWRGSFLRGQESPFSSSLCQADARHDVAETRNEIRHLPHETSVEMLLNAINWHERQSSLDAGAALTEVSL